MKNSIIRFVAAIACLIFLSGNVAANTLASSEQIAVQNIRSLIEKYQFQTGGALPESWKQFSEKINLSGFDSIKTNYVFISKSKVQMLGFEEGTALLIRTSPALNLSTNLGRYVISQNERGLKFNWYSEDKIQKLLAESGVKELPKPESAEIVNVPTTTMEPAAISPEISKIVKDDKSQPQQSHENVKNTSAPVSDQSTVSTSAPPVAVSAAPANGASWFGMIVVLGVGFFVAVFLLVRVKQK